MPWEFQVELLVMKALSKKLVKGTINQIDAVVDFTWVQVRASLHRHPCGQCAWLPFLRASSLENALVGGPRDPERSPAHLGAAFRRAAAALSDTPSPAGAWCRCPLSRAVCCCCWLRAAARAGREAAGQHAGPARRLAFGRRQSQQPHHRRRAGAGRRALDRNLRWVSGGPRPRRWRLGLARLAVATALTPDTRRFFRRASRVR